MGRSASLYPLVPTGATPHLPTNRAVREAITELFAELFENVIAGDSGAAALHWLQGGETAFLRVQDDDELDHTADTLALWLDRYADAPVEMAEHWLPFLMAWRRHQFEAVLGELGLAIPDDEWPDLRQVRAEAMARHCDCSVCTRWAKSLFPRYEVVPGTQAELLVASFVVSRLLAPRGGGLVATISHRDHMAWTARVDGDVLRPIPQLSHHTREVRLLQEVGDALVAFFVQPVDIACEWSESRDGGLTWSAPASTGLPATKGMHPYFSDARRDRVFVAAPDGATLYRSDDGGRSFGPATQVMLDGRPAYAIRDAMSCGDHVFALLVREYQGAVVLAVSDDGAAFRTVDPGLASVASLWATTDGALVAFGEADDEDTLARSRDGGESWKRGLLPPGAKQAVLGGRWFVTAEDGLWISDDEGETWRDVLAGHVSELALDGADPSSCYACVGGLMLHVVVG